ncbi:murein L,D-transpeptidase catalytic domain family protein [Pedobacter boryungensis]|uniref:Murein L,D-transpeptidase catalytic domain family protein n=1 Tax=Pedobacter boryungensis TaxID=869962 RepID=A0ABX2D8E5_9SPHI|nr:murein L,D-transpeptidase catalytic domain family protein [Pedobacter boryungensis]NQX30333.1 murein L,D-transpeptidase catalytic domain family protein [Pedobacter boryungensis]
MRKYIFRAAGFLSIAICLTITGWKAVKKKEPVIKSKVVKSKTITGLDSTYVKHVNGLYNAIHLKEAGLSFPIFEKALTGFYNLKKSGQLSDKSILTIADFDQSSVSKRLYIIDLDKKEILLNTWVAHGQRSGDNEATHFSNTKDSFSSSLGFYVTGEVYRGIHGRSLKLDGMDQGFNDHARSRSIVVHGAAYVSEGTINALGRLGRSQGCPAVAPEVADEVINTIGDKTVLFINKSIPTYSSKYLDETLAANFAVDSTTHLMD